MIVCHLTSLATCDTISLSPDCNIVINIILDSNDKKFNSALNESNELRGPSMAGGTNYSAVVGPRGTKYSAAHGLGGPNAAAMDGPR